MKLGTVRGKIVGNSALILILMASATLYTGFASLELARSVESLFRNNLTMENLKKTLDATEASLSEYLRTKSSDSLKDYIKYSTRLTDQSWGLGREIRANETLLLQRDLTRVFDTYLRVAEAAVQAKRGRDIQGYAEQFDIAQRHAGYARLLIADIQSRYLSESLGAFSLYESLIPGVLLSNAALVLAATALGFLLLIRYSYKLTDPLQRLAEAALAVGRGDFDATVPLVESDDEIGTTAQAFIIMRQSVRNSFDELRTRAIVEKTLLEEQMRVLELSHKLKDAEMLALQTQINPHFLFNTLSAGIQLASVENAERTTAFLENLAVFIRYALTPPGRFVVVADEIECVRRYIWLLQLRFGDRYAFDVQVDETVLGVQLPALILQPLVENSVGHGLANRESGGLIGIRGYRSGKEAVLVVHDNGDGMVARDIEAVLAEATDDDQPHMHGIGLRNVIRRILLSTNGRGRVEVESPEGRGTTVRISLPVDVETPAKAAS